MHLNNICRRFEIDTQEIDSSINYYENKSHLLGFRLKSYDELAEEWAKNHPYRGRMDAWATDLGEFEKVVRKTVKELKDTVGEVLAGQAKSVLMDWYLIGKEVQLAKQRLRLVGEDIGPKGWSGTRGKFMTDLSHELDLQKNELYDAVRFVQKFRNWDTFAEQKFDVPRKKGGLLESLKMSGSGLTWNQVRKYLLRDRAIMTTVRPNLCWTCGKQFFSESALSCDHCKTFVCPDGHCFCKLEPLIQRAIDYEVMSIGPQPSRWNRSNRKWLLSQQSASEKPIPKTHLSNEAEILANWIRLMGPRSEQEITKYLTEKKGKTLQAVEKAIAELLTDGQIVKDENGAVITDKRPGPDSTGTCTKTFEP